LPEFKAEKKMNGEILEKVKSFLKTAKDVSNELSKIRNLVFKWVNPCG